MEHTLPSFHDPPLPPAKWSRARLSQIPAFSDVNIWFVSFVVAVNSVTPDSIQRRLAVPLRASLRPPAGEAHLDPHTFRIRWLEEAPRTILAVFRCLLDTLWLTVSPKWGQSRAPTLTNLLLRWVQGSRHLVATVILPCFETLSGEQWIGPSRQVELWAKNVNFERSNVTHAGPDDPRARFRTDYPVVDFGPVFEMALGAVRPWTHEKALLLAKEFWNLILPESIRIADQEDCQSFVQFYRRHTDQWLWSDASSALLSAYDVIASRYLRPRRATRPARLPAPSPPGELITVPGALLTTIESGWLGLVGLHRSLLISAHATSTDLKATLAMRAVPLVSCYAMWEQFGMPVRPVYTTPLHPRAQASPLQGVALAAYAQERPLDLVRIDTQRGAALLAPVWGRPTRTSWCPKARTNTIIRPWAVRPVQEDEEAEKCYERQARRARARITAYLTRNSPVSNARALEELASQAAKGYSYVLLTPSGKLDVSENPSPPSPAADPPSDPRRQTAPAREASPNEEPLSPRSDSRSVSLSSAECDPPSSLEHARRTERSASESMARLLTLMQGSSFDLNHPAATTSLPETSESPVSGPASPANQSAPP